MRKKKIIYLVVILLCIITSYPISANITSSDQQIEPEGRLIFTALSMGPCGIAWGFFPGGNESNSSHTPDAYIAPGKGFMFNLGTMLYHESNGVFTNLFIEDNVLKVLWPLREITLVSITWQHETVKHGLKVTLKPQRETAGSFISNPKFYFILPPFFETQSSDFGLMEFSGTHRNGSKIENVSGFAGLIATDEDNSLPTFPKPTIGIYFVLKKDGGEYSPLMVVLWSKDGVNILGTEIEKAKTFYVNFWALQ